MRERCDLISKNKDSENRDTEYNECSVTEHQSIKSINQDILNAPANKYHVGAHGKMNGIKIKLNDNKCTTTKLICICIRF